MPESEQRLRRATLLVVAWLFALTWAITLKNSEDPHLCTEKYGQDAGWQHVSVAPIPR